MGTGIASIQHVEVLNLQSIVTDYCIDCEVLDQSCSLPRIASHGIFT